MAFSHYEEVWTDEILDLGGGVKDIEMRALAVFNDSGVITKRWRYFGTTSSEKPPTGGYPVDELPAKRSTLVVSDLASSEAQLLYDLAIVHDRDLLNK